MTRIREEEVPVFHCNYVCIRG